jgi:hypothetical protein
MEKKTIFGLVIIIAIIGGLAAWSMSLNSGPGKLDSFASCIKDKGATFYGAFWCPHCQAQKKMFGSSAKLLPYVECSSPDGKSQLPFCTQKGVESYPTWIFADGSTSTGEVDLETLAAKTSCVLPQ